MPLLTKAMRTLEQAKVLDPVANGYEKVVNTVLPEGRLKDLLHGKFLGHPLHPLLVAGPIGLWSGALLLDLSRDRGSGGKAAQTLVGAGVLAALPTAAAGLADWSQLGAFQRPKRVGLVHAVANVGMVLVYAASWRARRSGDQRLGKRLALVGAAGLGVGGYLGGHLAYSEGVGVNRNADEQRKPRDWTPLELDPADLAEGEMRRVEVSGQQVLLARTANGLQAIGAVCSHYGAPLEKGELTDGGDPCVICPWHRSEFRLRNGSVVRGPATAPQLSYEVRSAGSGRLEIRVRG